MASFGTSMPTLASAVCVSSSRAVCARFSRVQPRSVPVPRFGHLGTGGLRGPQGARGVGDSGWTLVVELWTVDGERARKDG